MRLKTLLVVALALGALAAGIVVSQSGYDFMAKGGKLLLAEVLDTCTTCDDEATLVTLEMTQDEWLAYFSEQETQLEELDEEELQRGALAGLTEQEAQTLAAYLAINVPVDVDNVQALPPDGNQLAQETCTICHAIAATVIEDRSATRWISHLQNPTHSGIGLSEGQMQELAHYLEINYPMSLEAVPEPLRTPMPSY